MGASRRYRRRLQSAARPVHTAGARGIDDNSPPVMALLEEALSAPEPYWLVKLIHDDPNGRCEHCRAGGAHATADFAYTVGLHQRYGLPELHCPSRPTPGLAPETMALQYDALGILLNVLAARTIVGEIGPGDSHTVTSTRADHRYHLCFTLGDPGPLAAVSAYQAHPDALAIPVTWAVVDVDCLEGAAS